MEGNRPNSPRVLGVLSIVFGSLVVAFSVFGLLSPGITRSIYHGSDLAAFDAYLAALQPWTTVLTTAMLLMSVALIFIGIGQRRYRRWAQLASVTWGWLGLVILAFQFAFWLNVVSPALDVFMDSISVFRGQGSVLSGFSSSFGFIALFLYAPYPILMIILMGRPNIVRAMSR